MIKEATNITFENERIQPRRIPLDDEIVARRLKTVEDNFKEMSEQGYGRLTTEQIENMVVTI